MKKIALLLYLLIVVAAGALIALMNREPYVKLVATRELPAHHLLKPGDLNLEVDGRQYLTSPLKEGDTIKSSKIMIIDDAVTDDDATISADVTTNDEVTTNDDAEPGEDVVIGADEIPVALTIDRDAMNSTVINPGDEIVVCPPSVPVEVRAVFCGGPDTPCIILAAAAVTVAENLKVAQQELSVLAGDACQ